MLRALIADRPRLLWLIPFAVPPPSRPRAAEVRP
jgi:hypothetical protein